MASDNGSTIHISELVPDPKNARQHTPRGLGMIEDSLQEVGAARSIVIDENNRILAGNQTTEAAANVGLEDVMIVDAPGDKLVAVRRSNLTEQQKTRLALWDNRSAEVATWSSEMLAKMQQEDEALLQGLFRADELEAILGDLAQEPVADPGAQIDRAAELQEKWQVERGQIWQIGRHRLMCGDSTSAEDVGWLMDGRKADCIVTDPPYGQAWLSNRYGPNRSAPNPQGKLTGDDEPRPELLTEWIGVLGADTALYVCTRWTLCETWCTWLARRLKIKNVIVWAKNNWSAGDLEGAYGFMYEQVIFAAKGKHKLRGPRLPDVWQFDRIPPGQHPTQKPVGLFMRCMEKSTDVGAIVADGFLGSGSTLVACEQTGRIGYGMEIEPKYCAVTLERLTGMGLEARKA